MCVTSHKCYTILVKYGLQNSTSQKSVTARYNISDACTKHGEQK